MDAEAADVLLLVDSFHRYYLAIASYGTMSTAKWSNDDPLEAVDAKGFAQDHNDRLTARRCSYHFCFLKQNAISRKMPFSSDHAT